MNSLRLIKNSELTKLRNHFAARQGYRCPICQATIAHGATALDHSHENGHCRGTLCMTCNTSEGKVLAAAKFRARKEHLTRTDTIQWLKNMIAYVEGHRESPSGLIHPTFDLSTGKQKPVKRKKATTKKSKP